MRILYLHGTFVPPPSVPQRDRFFWLSEKLEGDVLQDVWFGRKESLEKELGPGSYPSYRLGRFRYHFLLGGGHGGFRGKLALAWFFIRKGLELHREQPFDCVVTYSHTLTAVCGVILKFLTGAKLIVEIVIAPETAYGSQEARPGFRARLMRLYSDVCLHFCLWNSDRVHLLAPSLIAGYKRLRNIPASVFFEGVPVSTIPRHVNTGEQYVLLVGAPWRRKGVDVLIQAFLRLAADFPDVKLRLMGHYPDREALEELAKASPLIEFLKARPNQETLEIISKATVFALPSRCEGVPRVIMEAMAAGVPVVASDVDGIPVVVRDGEDGFLVPVEDVAALEARLRQLLSDERLRSTMGARGYELAHTEFSEQAYVDHFTRMVEVTVRGDAASSAAAAAGQPH
jgi:glycosyltransferase involved in cell wall biosynthesis